MSSNPEDFLRQKIHQVFVQTRPNVEMMLVMLLAIGQTKEAIMEKVAQTAAQAPNDKRQMIIDDVDAEIDYLIDADLDTLISDLEEISEEGDNEHQNH